MATKFEIFKTIQFSNFLFINNQVPTQALDVTNASKKGTLLLVNLVKTKYKIPNDISPSINAFK